MTTDHKIKEPEGFANDQINEEIDDVLEESRRHQQSHDHGNLDNYNLNDDEILNKDADDDIA